METKILETEKGNKDTVYLHWSGTDETWNAYGKSAENALRMNPELRTLTDEVNLDGTQVTHLKVTTNSSSGTALPTTAWRWTTRD